MRDEEVKGRMLTFVHNEGHDGLRIEGAPSVPGLKFRRLRLPEDYAALAEVMTRSRAADGVAIVTTVKDLAAIYESPHDFDVESDILVAEIEDKMIGLARAWHEKRSGLVAHVHSVELVPEYRHTKLREFMFEFNEKTIRAKVAGTRPEIPHFFELWANDEDNHWKSIVTARGYEHAQHEIDLVRSLEHIPEIPLPSGIEVRPATPKDYPKVWEANREAWRQDWNYSEERFSEERFQRFASSSEFQPELWQVAWDGDTLAGMVLSYILEEENEELGKKIGHTEYVFVREQYRGRGLAKALLARSFRALRDRGMEEATLGAEVENPHGALRLYEAMGFKVSRHFTWYRKRL